MSSPWFEIMCAVAGVLVAALVFLLCYFLAALWDWSRR